MMNRRAWLAVTVLGLGMAATGCSGKSIAQQREREPAEAAGDAGQAFPQAVSRGGFAAAGPEGAAAEACCPERNMLNAVIPARAQRQGAQGEQYSGLLNVDFALRYEPTDRTLRAYQIKGQPAQHGRAVARAQRYAGHLCHGIGRAGHGSGGTLSVGDQDLALVDALAMGAWRHHRHRQGLTVALVQKASARAASAELPGDKKPAGVCLAGFRVMRRSAGLGDGSRPVSRIVLAAAGEV